MINVCFFFFFFFFCCVTWYCYVVQKSSREDESGGSGDIEDKKACTDCKTTKTPLWRGGPAGPKVCMFVCFWSITILLSSLFCSFCLWVYDFFIWVSSFHIWVFWCLRLSNLCAFCKIQSNLLSLFLFFLGFWFFDLGNLYFQMGFGSFCWSMHLGHYMWLLVLTLFIYVYSVKVCDIFWLDGLGIFNGAFYWSPFLCFKIVCSSCVSFWLVGLGIFNLSYTVTTLCFLVFMVFLVLINGFWLVGFFSSHCVMLAGSDTERREVWWD